MEGIVNHSNNNQNAITESVFEVFAFFDLFNYPVTAHEVWRFASIKLDNFTVAQQALNDLVREKKLEQNQCFYFLRGRAELVAVRHKRYNITAEKFKYATRAAKLFRWLPWIKFIAVGNLIGSHNLRQESDIDLLIVTVKGRLWISRLMVTVVTKLLGWRPQKNNSKDKICLSFWVSEQGLDFSGLKLKTDPYFRYWLAGIYPIYDSADIYTKLIDANIWLKTELPNWTPKHSVCWRKVTILNFILFEKMFDILFGWNESLAKKIQLKLLSRELKRLMNLDTRVVVTDNVLKFHAKDRREEYKRSLEERIKNF